MDFGVFIFYAGILGYVGITIYLANQEQLNWHQDRRGTNGLLFIAPAMIALLALYAIMLASAGPQLTQLATESGDDAMTIPEIGGTSLAAIILVAVVVCVGSVQIIASKPSREWIEQKIGAHGAYRAASIVHTTALVFILWFVAANTMLFLMEGGTEAMAENIESSGVNVSATLLQMALFVVISFLGIGYSIRRGLPETLQRLGLRIPQSDDFVWSTITIVAAFIILSIFSNILALLFTQEQLEEQTRAAESVVNAFSTIPLAFLVATTAAVGEEIFFRGAVQPIFGIIPTSIFFALIHTQVLLSPGIVGIFLISLAFGWLRKKYSTTAAIIAHFIYNFLIVLINIAITSVGVS